MGITSAIFQALGKVLWENDPLIRLVIIGTVTGELSFKTLAVTLSYNPRDKLQILILAEQMNPGQTDFFLNQYEEAVKDPLVRY